MGCRSVAISGCVDLNLFLIISTLVSKIIIIATNGWANVISFFILIVAWGIIVAYSKSTTLATFAYCLTAADSGRFLPHLDKMIMMNDKDEEKATTLQ